MCILSVNCQQAVLSNGPAIIVYQHCITNRNGATSKGQVSFEDNERSKHPTSSLSDENTKKIRDLLKTDRYFSCRGIAEELNISISLRRSPESFEEEKRLLGIRKTRTIVLHPYSGGKVEHQHRTSIDYSVKLVNQDQKD
ncbi:integrase core domain protein [Vespula maculifrons]|uniref:Integrase core domain protein n=1 Tax=Vespula maculifrons TaxID=7453 RepID=A0ABD2CFE6_VESMC